MKENENKWIIAITFISNGTFMNFMDYCDSLVSATLAKEAWDSSPHVIFSEILHVSEVYK